MIAVGNSRPNTVEKYIMLTRQRYLSAAALVTVAAGAADGARLAHPTLPLRRSRMSGTAPLGASADAALSPVIEMGMALVGRRDVHCLAFDVVGETHVHGAGPRSRGRWPMRGVDRGEVLVVRALTA